MFMPRSQSGAEDPKKRSGGLNSVIVGVKQARGECGCVVNGTIIVFGVD